MLFFHSGIGLLEKPLKKKRINNSTSWVMRKSIVIYFILIIFIFNNNYYYENDITTGALFRYIYYDMTLLKLRAMLLSYARLVFCY